MCSSQRPFPIPVLHAHAPLVNVNPYLILRAIIAQEARDLDMALWNRAIESREEALENYGPGVEGTQDDEGQE